MTGIDIDCRVLEGKGKTYKVPTKEVLASAIFDIWFLDTAAGAYYIHSDK